jgi:hypothetical protein
MVYYNKYNNEDAGDATMMGYADWSAAQAEEEEAQKDRATIPTGGVLINPKYKTRCRKCGRPICRKGKAVWVKGHGCYHPACYPHSTRSPQPRRPRRVVFVRCVNCGDVDESTVEVLDISEGLMGEDILTFKCGCGKRQSSKRFTRR